MTREGWTMRGLTLTMLAAWLFETGIGATSARAQGAECYYNGRAVADGTRIGESVCRNGIWVEEP